MSEERIIHQEPFNDAMITVSQIDGKAALLTYTNKTAWGITTMIVSDTPTTDEISGAVKLARILLDEGRISQSVERVRDSIERNPNIMATMREMNMVYNVAITEAVEIVASSLRSSVATTIIEKLNRRLKK